MSAHLKLVDTASAATGEPLADEYSLEGRQRRLARLTPKEDRCRAAVVNEVAGKLVAIDLRTGARRVTQ